MPTMMKWSLGLFGLAMAAGSCLAQNMEPTKFYKLDFVVKGTDGATAARLVESFKRR